MPLEPTRKINYLGGINKLPLQGEGQAKLIQNARPLATGGLEVRYGQALTASVGADPTVGSITDLFAYRTSALGTRLYSLRRTNAGDKIFDSTTEITGPTLSGAEYTSIVEGKGTIFISDGNSADIEYHTPGQTTRAVITNSIGGSTLPQCQFLKVYRNRLYAWTDTGLRYSNTGIYTTLPACHFDDLNLVQVREENVEARGLGSGDNFLVLFAPDSYTIMTGTPGNNGARNDYSLEEFQGVGCGAPRTITSKGKRIAWIDPERRMRMLEGPTLRDLDEQDFIAEYLQAPNTMITASAKFLGRELWVLLPKASSTDRIILVYDLFLEKWIATFTKIEGYAISYLPEINAVYLGAHTGGYIWQQANGRFKPLNDAGTLIPFELIDAQLVFGTLWHQKLYEKILCSYRLSFSETLNFSYATDELDSFTSFELNPAVTAGSGGNWGDDNWGEFAWGTAGIKTTVLRPKVNYNLQTTSLRLKVSGNMSGGDLYYGSEAHATLLDRDGESGII